jgi:hypothetical protein
MRRSVSRSPRRGSDHLGATDCEHGRADVIPVDLVGSDVSISAAPAAFFFEAVRRMKLLVVIVNHRIADPAIDGHAWPAPGLVSNCFPRDVVCRSIFEKGFHV